MSEVHAVGTRVPLVIPLKAPKLAKERLAWSLSPAQREALSLAMLDDVLEAARSCADIESIWLLSADADVAKTRATGYIKDAIGNLNGASEHAARYLQERDYKHICILHADLPLLDADSLSIMVKRHHQLRAEQHGQACVTIATDTEKQGSNGMLCSPPCAVRFAYGQDSLRLHLRNAKEVGAATQVLEIPALATDIDNVANFEHLRKILSASNDGAQHTRRLMARL